MLVGIPEAIFCRGGLGDFLDFLPSRCFIFVLEMGAGRKPKLWTHKAKLLPLGSMVLWRCLTCQPPFDMVYIVEYLSASRKGWTSDGTAAHHPHRVASPPPQLSVYLFPPSTARLKCLDVSWPRVKSMYGYDLQRSLSEMSTDTQMPPSPRSDALSTARTPRNIPQTPPKPTRQS